MSEATVRDLRNRGGQIIDQVLGGDSVTITRDGEAVARLAPLARRPLSAVALVERFRRLPPMEPDRLRADIDMLIDQSL